MCNTEYIASRNILTDELTLELTGELTSTKRYIIKEPIFSKAI